MGDRLDGTGWFSAPHAIFESSLSSDCKLILLYLCRCAGTDGKAFPSYRDIAKKCGLSRRHTIDLIGQMKDAGIIEAKMQTRNDGGSTSNLYNLDLSKLPGGVHSVHRGGAQRAPGGVNCVHPHPNNKGSNKDLNLKNKNLKNSTADSPAANTACSVPPPKRNGHKIPYDQLPDDFSSLLDIARTLPEKYPPYKKTPRARKLTYHPNWYTVCQKGLDILRGARDTGTGYSISLRYLKEAFESGYTPEQWLLCAQRLFELQADGEEWLANIRASTVNKALPDFIAGRLGSARAPTNVYVAPQGERVVDKLRAMGRLE